MLKKFLTILSIFVLGGWAFSQYFNNSLNLKTYKVFSTIKTIGTIKEEPDIIITDIIEETNKQRVLEGLPPLSINEKLNESSDIKTQDMIDLQYFEHNSPNGDGVSDLGTKVGYQYVVMGENLALGNFSSAKEIVDAWMNSPGHRANILSSKYQEIGVSVKYAKYEGKNVWFAVQHFGTSRIVCPSIDTNLKASIDALNRELKAEEGIIINLKKSLEAPGAQNQSSYQSMIETFNAKVDAYNAKLVASKQKINIYNQEVRRFNSCITAFQ